VVLIPAMAWGSREKGYGLILNPATLPPAPSTQSEAQAVLDKVEAQGALFVVAHPCFPHAPWQWNLYGFNGVEVWCRGWREVPPIVPESLAEQTRLRQDKQLVHAVATAAATSGLSANGQAVVFWQEELRRDQLICLVGGSYSASASVPLGKPSTYVLAREKSVAGILEGIQKGRTYLTAGPDAPTVRFNADILDDGKVDIGIGGVIPVDRKSRLIVQIWNGKGKKLEIMRDNLPLSTVTIEEDAVEHSLAETPDRNASYWVRITESPTEEGFGSSDVVALTSPIYAQRFVVVDPNADPADVRVRLRTQTQPKVEEVELPDDPTVGEIKPQWQVN